MASTSEAAANRVRLCADVVINDIEDGLLVVNLDTGKTWKLNRVGAIVCHAIDQGREVASVVAELAVQYRVDEAVVRRDVDALVAALRTEGLVEPRTGA